MNEEDWRFTGVLLTAGNTPAVRVYAHVAYASCRALVAEDDRLDHEQWHERLTEEIYPGACGIGSAR